MANPVCYGDIVFIDLNNHLLFSNGFFDPIVHFVSKANICLKAFRFGLFKIYPNLSYKDYTQVDQLKDQLDLLKSLDPAADLAYEELANDLKQEQIALEERDAKLDLLNDKILKEAQGKPIKYGQKIQLFHLQSQTFLSPLKTSNKNDKAMLELGLTKTGHRNIYFNFKPMLGFIREGEVVEYNTPLQIVSAKTETPIVKGDEIKLDEAKKQINDLSNPLINNPNDFPTIRPRRKEPLFQQEKIFSSGLKPVEKAENTSVRKYLPFQDQEEIRKKKAFTNGDYIRISNDKVYLTLCPGKTDLLCFQGFSDLQDYRYNNIYTLFQIVEIPAISQEAKVEGQTELNQGMNSNYLPKGTTIDASENKKYFLKHVVTGKLLICENGVLKLESRADANQNIEKISVVIKNKTKDNTSEKFIDRNSIMQVKFYNAKNEYQGVLSIGQVIKITNVNPDVNTSYFYGFDPTDDYLIKALRTERYAPRIRPDVDGKSSLLKFTRLSTNEHTHIFLAESVANQFGKFLDFLNGFIKGEESFSVHQLNNEVKKLTEICDKFRKQMYEEEYSQEDQDILTPNKLIQTLMREFRVYDMIYRLFFYIIKDDSLLNKVIELKRKGRGETTLAPTKTQARGSVLMDEGVNRKEINFENLLKLFDTLKKILLVSFKKNPLNRTYCSQFVRVPINCLLRSDGGVFSLSSFKNRMQMKEIMLALCKKGLWDDDLDALGQLNHYQDPIFQCIKNQESFHSIYLSLIEHVSRSRAPNLENKLRNNFLSDFLREEDNIKHVFPTLVEEGDKIYVEFNRQTFPELGFKVDLKELNEQLLNSEIKNTPEEDRIRTATTYLIRSLDLITALVMGNSSTWSLMIVKYYRYETLIKAINMLKNSPNHREIRLSMGEIINVVHQRFFSLPYVKLPIKLQVINENSKMSTILQGINKFIKDAVDTSLSASEIAYLKSKDVLNIINPLKSMITSSSDVDEVLRFITSDISVKKLDEARVAIEEIGKVLETASDVDLEFLKVSHRIVAGLISEAIGLGKKSFDFIDEALKVFTLIEKNIVTYATTDIIGNLQARNLLKQESSEENEKHWTSFDLTQFLKPKSPTGSYTKIVPFDSSEQHGGHQHKTRELNVISDLSRDWKNGKKLVPHSTPKVNETTDNQGLYKEFSTNDVVKILLDISLLNDQQLMDGAIEQLRRIACYEDVLYYELNKFVIVHEPSSLEKIESLIKSTFRLNEISREVFFCSNNQINIEESKMNELYFEVMDHLWEILFSIYSPSQHFRHSDGDLTPEERFKEAFLSSKHFKHDKCIKLNANAIRRPFQKIFNILKVSHVLLKTLQWTLTSKHKTEDRTYIIRIILIILRAFLNENTENQQLFSNMNDFIHLYYKHAYINETPDTMLVFAEMMKGNPNLLKLSMKYLFDITLTPFLESLETKISNNENTGYLGASIASYEYLLKCQLPEEIFSPIYDLRVKWQQISAVDDFVSLNILSYHDDLIVQPFCYKSISLTMEATMLTLEHFAGDLKSITRIQVILPFLTWLSFFESKNYLLQFELKNLITNCISKIYFEFGKKGKFTQKFEECSSIFACLVSDIMFFRKYVNSKEKQDSPSLNKLSEGVNFVTSHPHYEKIKNMYALADGIQLETKKLRSDIEAISLFNLLTEYIYGGCLDLLFHLVLHEVDYFTEFVDVKTDMRTLMEYVLLMIEEMVDNEGTKPSFPSLKVEKFLNNASVIRSYSQYKEKISAITSKVLRNREKGAHLHKRIRTLHEKEMQASPLEIFQKHLESLRKSKTKLKEKNIKEIAEAIAHHKDSNGILKQIISCLKKDQTILDLGDVKFLLKLLRKYIEREHDCEFSDLSVDQWTEVNISELKKITKIQNYYKELGLTEILYSFMSTNDPKVFRETLLLSLAYLYGGNSAVQEEFFNNFLDDDENEVLELLSNQLKTNWNIFRSKETERINYLYAMVQKSLFKFLKENSSLEQLKQENEKLRKFEAALDPKYVENAENLPSNKNFILILSFLQSLCEKQYTNMQIFLREQTWKGRSYPRSFDFLGFLRQCLNSYNKILSKYNLAVGSKVLALITELIQGDVVENISVFLNKSFIYDMCRIVTDYNSRYHTLPRGFGLDPFSEDFRKIKSQAIFVFKTMLENKNEENIKVLTEHLDMVGLMRMFEQLIQNFLTKKNLHRKVGFSDAFISSLSNEDFKDTLGDAINIYIMYRYVWDKSIEFNEKMRELIGRMNKGSQDLLGRVIFILFKRLVSSIEIIAETKSDPFMRVWFPVLAVCNYLNEEAQTNFLAKVDRSNIQTKISGLTDATQEFVPQMNAEYKARNRLFGFDYKKIFSFLRLITNLIGLAITCTNVATYQYEDDDTVQDQVAFDAVRGLSIVQIVIAGILALLWLPFFGKRHQSLNWERYVDNNVKLIGPLPPTVKNKIDGGNHDEMDESDCKLVMILEGANSEVFKEVKRYAPSFKLISIHYYLLNTWFLLSSMNFIWQIIYFGITIGAAFHPLVAVFEIFDIAIRSDTVKQLYGAMSKNVTQFFWTLFLLVVTNVVYSTIGFFFLNDAFVADNENALCTTAFSCFMNVLNLGLRNGGGISDTIGPQPYATDGAGKFVLRILFDLSFFIIMIILLLNLIFGMIIDSFGELRDQKASNDEDQMNVCFICGISRSDFERHASFEEHIADEHNVWSYVYYIVYLLDKQKTSKVDMTDIENLVVEKYQQKDYDWFPVGQSLTLEKLMKLENVNKEDEIAKLSKKFEAIQKIVIENDVRINAKIEKLTNMIKK